jgi:hypothetical protein
VVAADVAPAVVADVVAAVVAVVAADAVEVVAVESLDVECASAHRRPGVRSPARAPLHGHRAAHDRARDHDDEAEPFVGGISSAKLFNAARTTEAATASSLSRVPRAGDRSPRCWSGAQSRGSQAARSSDLGRCSRGSRRSTPSTLRRARCGPGVGRLPTVGTRRRPRDDRKSAQFRASRATGSARKWLQTSRRSSQILSNGLRINEKTPA